MLLPGEIDTKRDEFPMMYGCDNLLGCLQTVSLTRIKQTSKPNTITPKVSKRIDLGGILVETVIQSIISNKFHPRHFEGLISIKLMSKNGASTCIPNKFF